MPTQRRRIANPRFHPSLLIRLKLLPALYCCFSEFPIKHMHKIKPIACSPARKKYRRAYSKVGKRGEAPASVQSRECTRPHRLHAPGLKSHNPTELVLPSELLLQQQKCNFLHIFRGVFHVRKFQQFTHLTNVDEKKSPRSLLRRGRGGGSVGGGSAIFLKGGFDVRLNLVLDGLSGPLRRVGHAVQEPTNSSCKVRTYNQQVGAYGTCEDVLRLCY